MCRYSDPYAAIYKSFARWIAGSPELKPEFDSIRAQVLRLPRNPQELGDEVIGMREKIHHAKRSVQATRVDLKHSRGCMVDIEFMVQYWMLVHANKIGSDCLYSDNIALIKELVRLGLISRSQSELVGIYQTYHRLLHESLLQDGSAEIDAELIVDEMKLVTRCWNECFGREK